MLQKSVCAQSLKSPAKMRQEWEARSALTTEVEEGPHLLSPYPKTTEAHTAKASILLGPSPPLGFLHPGFKASAILEPEVDRRKGVQGTVLATPGPEISWGCSTEARKRPGFCPSVRLQMMHSHPLHLWPRTLSTFPLSRPIGSHHALLTRGR